MAEYADIFNILVNSEAKAETMEINLSYSLTKRPVASVTLSYKTAKELSMLLRRFVKDFERMRQAPVSLSDEVYQMMQVAPEDW